MADIKVNGTFRNNTTSGAIAYASQIQAESNKMQDVVNRNFDTRLKDLENSSSGGGSSADLTPIENRLAALEQNMGVSTAPSNYMIGGYYNSANPTKLISHDGYGYTKQFIYFGAGNNGVTRSFKVYFGNALIENLYRKSYIVLFDSNFSRIDYFQTINGSSGATSNTITVNQNKGEFIWLKISFPLKYKDDFRITTVVNETEVEVWKPKDHYLSEIELLHDDECEIRDLINNGAQGETHIVTDYDFKCFFFTDVHGADENVKRIAALANGWGRNYLNAILNAGDTVELVYAQEAIKRGATAQASGSATAYNTAYDSYGMTWYDEIMDDCEVSSLTAIGNHDIKCDCTKSGNNVPAAETDADWGSELQIYNRFVKPTVERFQDRVLSNPTLGDEKWDDGIITHSDNDCYYYVDYNTVRVIVLCSMSDADVVSEFSCEEGSAQYTFFTNALAGAKTANKAVIVLNHTSRTITLTSRFNSGNNASSNWQPNASMVTAVDNFISNGGNFICWLAGHTHVDAFGTVGTQSQAVLISASARFNYTRNIPNPKRKFFDLFNYISVNTSSKVLCIKRIGATKSKGKGERDFLIYNYGTHTVLHDGDYTS